MAGNIVSDIDNLVHIGNVIVSVSNKAGLDKFVPELVRINDGIHFYSTGGTYTFLEKILGGKAGSSRRSRSTRSSPRRRGAS
jgi:phosphoribosylaminoimidazolecarboxamide formyltransferase/IMP cyclohydrolase